MFWCLDCIDYFCGECFDFYFFLLVLDKYNICSFVEVKKDFGFVMKVRKFVLNIVCGLLNFVLNKNVFVVIFVCF